MKSEKISDQRIVVSITVILILILLLLGLDAVFIHGREYYQDTGSIPPYSNRILVQSLQRGDRVNIQINTLEERPVQLLVEGGGIEFNAKGSRMDFYVPIPNSSHYRFILNNPRDERLLLSYEYEIVLMHSFWSGVALLACTLIITITMLVSFQKEVSKRVKSLFKNLERQNLLQTLIKGGKNG